ncbi:hypothetical protein C0995_002593 [Termitomyces sp. Mi166|nr:hypothetical protein C0995_002593 [Termitomyces sp. Mi166\
MIDMFSIPLLHSNASEEFETGRGGGGSYSQPTTSSRLQQDLEGTQVAGSSSKYVSYVPREHYPSSSGAFPCPDNGQAAFNFSALPIGQPIDSQQSQGTIGAYRPSIRESQEPQIYYSNDAHKWDLLGPQYGNHSRPSTTNHLAGQPGFYHRGGDQDMPPHQHLGSGQGLSPSDTFQLHGQHHLHTNPSHSSVDLPSLSHSAGNIKFDSDSMEHWLRDNSGIPPSQPLNLWSLEPQEDNGQRPKWTYKVLVALAIWGSPTGRLSLQEIYSQIENRFHYYRDLPDEAGHDRKKGGKKWQRSIRHNLSLESIFHHEGRDITEPGKGGYWSLTNCNGFGQKRQRKRRSVH